MATGPVAIFAGTGALPLMLADRLTVAGRSHRILAFRGFADRNLKARADAVVGLLDLRRIIAMLEAWAPSGVVLVGGLTRPDPRALLDAYQLLRSRAELSQILARGDDNLLRGALSLIEERGVPVLGIHELAPDFLAKAGPYGAVSADGKARDEIALALSVLDGLSAYDIGQAAIVRGRRVLAIEGPEGTDGMIRRSRAFRGGVPLRRPPRSGVLVKAPKRGQDLRVDLPAIGPRTVENAAKAGIAGIAVVSGLTLVLQPAATAAAADRHGLFLVGVDPLHPADGKLADPTCPEGGW